MSTLLAFLLKVVGCGIALHYLLNMTRAVPQVIQPLDDAATGRGLSDKAIANFNGFPSQRPSIRMQP